MAIEIRELIIKAIVVDNDDDDEGSGQVEIDKDAIVQECVDQVLKIIKKNNLR